MRTRQEIKLIGKEQFKANYWTCVLATLLIGIALGILSSIAYGPQYSEMINAATEGREPQIRVTFTANILVIAELLLCGPLTIGLNAFFVRNLMGMRDDLNVGTPFVEAFKGFGRKLGGFLWMLLFVYLWSLLLVIPGIIKTYSYAMSPYILSDCPNVRATDALKLSKRIMAGHKWELFVFTLSFIGWELLDILTLGLLDVFFVSPYRNSAMACYYLEVRETALRNGVITMEQLEGTVPV